jgi:hypothetical protein
MLALSGIARSAIHRLLAKPVMPLSRETAGRHQGQQSRADRAIWHHPVDHLATGAGRRSHQGPAALRFMQALAQPM